MLIYCSGQAEQKAHKAPRPPKQPLVQDFQFFPTRQDNEYNENNLSVYKFNRDQNMVLFTKIPPPQQINIYVSYSI